MSFTGLIAWQKSHQLVLAILKTTANIHRSDVLKNQIERAALSISSNIAEGFGRQTKADKTHFYVMARGSTHEIQSQLLVARDPNKITKEEFDRLATLSLDPAKLLHGLIRSLNKERNAFS